MNNILEVVESKNRISLKEVYEPIVCGNTNYYMKFTFDEEWENAENKQLIIEVLGKKIFLDIPEDNICKLPSMPNASSMLIMVNCFSENDENYSSNALKIELEPNPMKESVETYEPFSDYLTKLITAVDEISKGEIITKKSDYSTTSGKSETQVSLTGNEDIEGTKNFKTQITKKSKVVPNISEVSNPNLLINPEMLINQRGKTNYTGQDVYASDRWKLGYTNSDATKLENGKWKFTISDEKVIGQAVYVAQRFEDYKNYIGKTVTATINYSDVSYTNGNYPVLFLYDGSTQVVKNMTNQTNEVSVTLTVGEKANRLVVGICTKMHGGGGSFVFNWCKLEAGSSSTAFSPKIYAQDFRDCQRYYQKVRLNGGASTASTASALYCAIPLPATMRTTPTIVSYTIPSIRGNGTMVNATSVSMNSYFDNIVVLNCYGGGSLTQYQTYALHNGEVELDAEIY